MGEPTYRPNVQHTLALKLGLPLQVDVVVGGFVLKLVVDVTWPPPVGPPNAASLMYPLNVCVHTGEVPVVLLQLYVVWPDSLQVAPEGVQVAVV